MHVHCLQIDIAFGDVEKNITKVKQLMATLPEEVDTVILPELWTTGYALDALSQLVTPEIFDTLKRLAKQYHVDFIAGSVATETEGQFFNTFVVINKKGELVHRYDKVHLFRLMDEEKYLAEGTGMGTFNLNGIEQAGVVCYDIRFPEWIKTQMLHQAKVLYVVAEWPKKRIDHWRTLLIARAIENQAYVVACNRIGEDPANVFGGHSMVIGPWGDILAEAGETETTLTVALDLTEVDRVRKNIPIYEDRRPNLYRYD